MTWCCYTLQPDKREVWQYSGRTLEKSFLYEVTSGCGLSSYNVVDTDCC